MNHALALSALISSILGNGHVACLKLNYGSSANETHCMRLEVDSLQRVIARHWKFTNWNPTVHEL